MPWPGTIPSLARRRSPRVRRRVARSRAGVASRHGRDPAAPRRTERRRPAPDDVDHHRRRLRRPRDRLRDLGLHAQVGPRRHPGQAHRDRVGARARAGDAERGGALRRRAGVQGGGVRHGSRTATTRSATGSSPRRRRPTTSRTRSTSRRRSSRTPRTPRSRRRARTRSSRRSSRRPTAGSISPPCARGARSRRSTSSSTRRACARGRQGDQAPRGPADAVLRGREGDVELGGGAHRGGRGDRELVGAVVERLVRVLGAGLVAADPVPAHRRGARSRPRAPCTRSWFLTGSPAAVFQPLRFQPGIHFVIESSISRESVTMHARVPAGSERSPSSAAVYSIRLLVVCASPPESSTGRRRRADHDRRPAAGAGIAATGAVGPHEDLALAGLERLLGTGGTARHGRQY